MSQIRASFHHDGLAAGPVDVEFELIRLHAKGGIAALNLRKPWCCRNIAKRRIPVSGPRQVIDGCIGVTAEHIGTKAEGIAFEINSLQAGAVVERIVHEGGDAVGDGNAGADYKPTRLSVLRNTGRTRFLL